MKLKSLFIVSAIVLSALGMGLLFLPEALITMRTGEIPNELTLHVARQFGILSLGLAFVAFSIRSAEDSLERKAVALGLTITFFLLPLETAWSIIQGTESAEGWVLVIVFAFITLGFITSEKSSIN